MKLEPDELDETVVALDPYNSDLNLVLNASRYTAEPLTKEGFAFMWAGVRATHGFAKGKICYEVKIVEHLNVSHLPEDEPNPHVVRVGFSVESSTLQLGEDPLSYGYGGTGKISTNCQFKDFGGPFMSGDVILAVLNMDTDPVQMGYAKNGKFLGWAYRVKKQELKGLALFPHILSKNTSFEVNFGQKEKPYFPLPEAAKDFTFVNCTPMDQRISGARAPKKQDCEMIMMCGLPGAGKSVWAADYSIKHPDKKYNILGTNNIIDKMKVMGLPRKRNYHGRWDVLIKMATNCLNKMFEIGSKLRRNYVLDQTNVYPTAQRRKMRNFEGFKRIAVVVVPSEAEWKKRCDKRDREEGKEIPDSAVNEMKANFKIPEKNDIFDEVMFTECQREEAEKLVKMYNEEGRAATGPPRKQFRSNEPSGFGNRGFDSNRGDSNQGSPGRSGYGGRGGYGNVSSPGQDSPGRFGGGRGGYGGNRNDYEGNRGSSSPGGYGENRTGFAGSRGGRGGSDSGRGGYEGSRGGFGGNRGGYDRGGFGERRGGYEGGRGGGFDGNRGRYGGDRGSFDEERGGYGGSRGGYDGGRGGYDGGRGGYNGGRGGYDRNRSDFDSRRGYEGNFDDYDGGSRGFDNNRGGFGGGRGGYDDGRGRKRGYDDGRFDQSSSGGGSPGGYGNNSPGNYGDSSSYGSNRGFGSSRGGRGRGDFGSRSFGGQGGNNFSSSTPSDQYSGRYNQNDDSSSYDKGGSFSGGQRGRGGQNRGGTPRGGQSRGGNSGARGGYGSSGRGGYGGNDYGQDSSSSYGGSYGDYQNEYANQSQSGYRSSTDAYSKRDAGYGSAPQGGFKREPGTESGSYDSGSRLNQGTTRASGKTSRWSAAEPVQTSSYTSPAIQDSTYSKFGAQVKTETPSATGYDSYSGQTSSYASYGQNTTTTPGYPAAASAQSYSYQQSSAPVTQQWPAQPAVTPSTPATPATADQSQWSQYYQQQASQPNQYYSQYYSQPAAGTNPGY